jgi:5-methyltetrahydrofolate--homocysteine methyltransferase
LREQVRIVIGGAPITQSYADEIGADGYAEDASSAVRLVKEVLAA